MENNLISSEPAVIASLLDGMLYSVLEKEQLPIEQEKLISESNHFNHLGDNNKYILFLLNYQNSKKVLPDSDLELITKTLTALKLELRDVVLINHAEYPNKTLLDLIEYFSANKMVIFDITPKQIGIENEFTLNSISQFNHKPILFTSSLTTLQTNSDLKLVWWAAMKQLLGN